MASRLHEIYGSPNLGNKDDPTEEFAYILLSRKTPERAYSASFGALSRLGTWDEIAELSPEEIASAIFGGGLEGKKAKAISEGIREIKRRLGRADLSKVAHFDDEALFEFLVSLPEVGPKSALCIMLYGFKREAFPVDAHVGRVLARVGVFKAVGIDLIPSDHKQRQRQLRDRVPPGLRYSLHVNLIAHGRAVCKARKPGCHDCALAACCDFARERQPDQTIQTTPGNKQSTVAG
ncbi:endonuclease III [bacterium]|nr:endonuclease III [bacterium]